MAAKRKRRVATRRRTVGHSVRVEERARARARTDAPALVRFLRRRQRSERDLLAWIERRTAGLALSPETAHAYGEELREEFLRIQSRARTQPLPLL